MTSAADLAELRGQRDLEDDMRPRARVYMSSLIRPIFGPGPRHGEYGLSDISQNYPLFQNVIYFVLMLDKIHVSHLKLCQISFIIKFNRYYNYKISYERFIQ